MASISAALNKKVVSHEEWLAARKAFLQKEKELTHLRDQVSRQRLELPWEKVEKNYVFDGPNGKQSLAELFAGRSQLLVYHFMLGPDWVEGCPSCSFLSDHFDGMLPHLGARDVTFTAISRAPMPQIAAFKKRMGWKFNWVSSNANSFNFDYKVSFTPEEIATGEANYNFGTISLPIEECPGASAFYKDEAGNVYHTYSTYARGLDIFLGAYNFLDIAPKGRDEDGLAFTMAWVKHHDKYTGQDVVDAQRGYTPPGKSHECCKKDALA
jgi:predicted dithiol-disulfide oxidoreductase (DUF899 family)